ncbi:hypothetical protein PVK06_017796 [Gossypium arboreum]|uniref:Uncharacterized protein n=1 Tax=Gossypium arboreum TaxID=29729 RepID=A0ABR0Q459_GOSAR|nr:hypothetical protein PVK06_017796 [Gossypium arboreum]
MVESAQALSIEYAWKLEYKDTEDKCIQLERKFKSLEEGKSSLREQLKTHELCHNGKLDSPRQSREEAFKKYQEDTVRNLTKALPKLRSNLVLHTQVATSLMDLSQVDFDFLKDITAGSLSFIIYNPEGKIGRNFNQNGNKPPVLLPPIRLKHMRK